MPAPKRPNYFQSQFLIVRDFVDEQKYHEESLRRHNLLLHEWGVVRDGLQVTKSGDNFSISPGSAIDSLGREIILDAARTLTAAEVQTARQATTQDVSVTIAFNEIDSTETLDKYPPPGGTENVTRKMQSPDIVATKTPASDGTVVILARIAANGTVTNSVRKLASSFIPRGTNLGDISLDGALAFTSKTSPTPQLGLDYDPAGDQLRIRARSQNAAILDTTYVTIKRDSGNVGIGTADAPGQKLEVGGALKLTGNPTVINNNLGAYFWNQDKVGPTIAGYSFEVRTNGDTARLRIDKDGKVGIGTTIPVTKLHVAGNGSALPEKSTAQQSVGHVVRLRGSTNSLLDIGSAGDKGFWLQSTDLGNLAKNYPLLLNPNGGNVGIGTNSPTTLLHIRNDNPSGLGPTLSLMNGGGLDGAEVHIDLHTYSNGTLPNPSGRIICRDNARASGDLIFQTKQEGGDTMSERLRIDASGNVGIGTNSPKALLHIRKDNPNKLGPTLSLMNGGGLDGAEVHIDLHTYSNGTLPNPSGRIICRDNARSTGHLIFQTKQEGADTMVERLRIDASGNIGIGTDKPKAKLDVGDQSENIMKSILARLPEGHPNTFLGVKSFRTQPAKAGDDVDVKSFALQHYFSDKLNSAINFHRGGGEEGGYITFDTGNGTRRMRLDDSRLHVEGGITCGGKIGLKSSKWTNRWISARPANDGWVVRTTDVLDDYEEFTLVMRCSREFKENISDLTALEAMTTLQNLTPVKYDYKGERAFRQNLGFIAEDMPDSLSSEDRKSISPFEVIPILTKVAKEQQRVIAELQETVRTLATKKHKENC